MDPDWDDSEEYVIRAVPPPEPREWYTTDRNSRTVRLLSWWEYAEAFSAAADRLVVYSPESSRESDVQPIVFLYRHSLELRLKDIVDVGSRLLGGQEPLASRHDLLALWRRARVQIERVFPQESDTQTLRVLQDRIVEFNDLDAKSDRFRYPFDRSGRPWSVTAQKIDVRSLKNLMHDIFIHLSAVRFQMIRHVESRRGLSSLQIYAKWTLGTENPEDIARIAHVLAHLDNPPPEVKEAVEELTLLRERRLLACRSVFHAEQRVGMLIEKAGLDFIRTLTAG